MSESLKSVNGWSNVFTWKVALWLDNDRTIRAAAIQTARVTRYLSHGQGTRYLVSRALKSLVEQLTDDVLSPVSLQRDLINSALAFVDWAAIAENILNQIEEEDAEEDEA